MVFYNIVASPIELSKEVRVTTMSEVSQVHIEVFIVSLISYMSKFICQLV